MSFIPNTTPTPNWLYNGEMAKMKDVELRVVLVVTRATLGWEADTVTGMRKQEDWLTRGQIAQKTGRGNRSISRAIQACVERGWIEARAKDGGLLDTPEKREQHGGQKIYYRLGNIFMDKLEPLPKVQGTLAKSARIPLPKVPPTKETDTKETPKREEDAGASFIPTVINAFQEVNPSYRTLFGRPAQREAARRLVETHGLERVLRVVAFLLRSNGIPFLPTITTPFQLEEKWAALEAGVQKKRAELTAKGKKIIGL